MTEEVQYRLYYRSQVVLEDVITLFYYTGYRNEEEDYFTRSEVLEEPDEIEKFKHIGELKYFRELNEASYTRMLKAIQNNSEILEKAFDDEGAEEVYEGLIYFLESYRKRFIDWFANHNIIPPDLVDKKPDPKSDKVAKKKIKTKPTGRNSAKMKRNEEIRREYSKLEKTIKKKAALEQLSEKHNLSPSTIETIIYNPDY